MSAGLSDSLSDGSLEGVVIRKEGLIVGFTVVIFSIGGVAIVDLRFSLTVVGLAGLLADWVE